MKVKDIINTQTDFSFAGDTKVNFTVKPQGNEVYFREDAFWLRNYPEVSEMEVESWMICNARGNKCSFVILVKRDYEYEEKRKKAWEKLINKKENQTY